MLSAAGEVRGQFAPWVEGGAYEQNREPRPLAIPTALFTTITLNAPIFGNCDADPTIGLVDYNCFFDCMDGPELDEGLNCTLFDLNADGHVDLRDFFVLQSLFGRD